MGCRYACVCGGRCWTCSQYIPESYYGEAEDVLAQTKGFATDEEWQRYKRLENEEFKRQEEEYYKGLEEEYYRQLEQQYDK